LPLNQSCSRSEDLAAACFVISLGLACLLLLPRKQLLGVS
jgi:hypothetical protein